MNQIILVCIFFCCIHAIASGDKELFNGEKETNPQISFFDDGSYVIATKLNNQNKIQIYCFDKNENIQFQQVFVQDPLFIREIAVTKGIITNQVKHAFYMIVSYEPNQSLTLLKVFRMEIKFSDKQIVSKQVLERNTTDTNNGEILHPKIVYVKTVIDGGSILEQVATSWEIKDTNGNYLLKAALFSFRKITDYSLSTSYQIMQNTVVDSPSSLYPAIAASEDEIFLTYVTKQSGIQNLNYRIYKVYSSIYLDEIVQNEKEIGDNQVSRVEAKQKGFFFGVMCVFDDGVFGFSIKHTDSTFPIYVLTKNKVYFSSFDIIDGRIVLFNAFENYDQIGLELSFFQFFEGTIPYIEQNQREILNNEPNTKYSNLIIEVTLSGRIILIWNKNSEYLYGKIISYCDDSSLWDYTKKDCVCNKGYYFSGRENPSLCTACDKYSYKNVIGNYPCLPCRNNSIIVGEIVGTSIDQCKCQKGYYLQVETQKCIQCTQGTSKNFDGNGECTQCGIGYYSNDDFTDCTSTQIDSVPFMALFFTITAGLTGVIVFVIVVAVIAAVVFFILLKKSNAKANRFDHIEGVDMILKEAELEQQEISSKMIPKVKVKSSSYIIDFKEIKIIKKIGQGSSSSIVYLADWNGTKCAFKGFSEGSSLVGTDETTFNEFEKEVEICVKLSHPGILQFYGASITPKRIGLLVQYCSNGDLSTFIQSKRKEIEGGYPIKEKLRLLKEIVGGMKYLHNRKLLHRDLKPENILLDENEKSKIMDFGLSKTIDNAEEKTMTKMIGTVFYMSPEVIEGINYSFPCDVYSFGIMAFVILSENFYPYGKKISQPAIMGKVVVDPQFRPEIDEEKFKECEFLIPIIKKCWNFKPEERYTFEQLDVELSKKENQ